MRMFLGLMLKDSLMGSGPASMMDTGTPTGTMLM